MKLLKGNVFTGSAQPGFTPLNQEADPRLEAEAPPLPPCDTTPTGMHPFIHSGLAILTVMKFV